MPGIGNGINPYKFDRPFRLKIIALMLDNYWMATVGDTIIKPEYFESEEEERVVAAILDYRSAYRKSPDDPDDLSVLAGEDAIELVHHIFNGLYDWDLDLARDMSIRFAKEQAVKLAILDSIDDVNSGNLASPVEKVKEALKVGEDILSPGIDPIRDIDKWLYTYWTNKVRTGWSWIDRIIDGGVGDELGVILARQNLGKSMGLINIGYSAASLGSGKNVGHFTTEMKEDQVAKRYAARAMFRFVRPEDDLGLYADELRETARKFMPGNIRVIPAHNMSVRSVEANIDKLFNEGFNPGLIIIDYGDMLQPPKSYNERRYELSAIYQYIRDEIVMKYHIPVWTASQATRDAHSKEIVTMADIAEDIGKVSIADIIISLCQTYEESQNNLCRLFMAKVRDGRSGQLISAKYIPESQAIVSTGYAKIRDKKDKPTNGKVKGA